MRGTFFLERTLKWGLVGGCLGSSRRGLEEERAGGAAEGREEGNFVGRTFLKLNLKRAVL